MLLEDSRECPGSAGSVSVAHTASSLGLHRTSPGPAAGGRGASPPQGPVPKKPRNGPVSELGVKLIAIVRATEGKGGFRSQTRCG